MGNKKVPNIFTYLHDLKKIALNKNLIVVDVYI